MYVMCLKGQPRHPAGQEGKCKRKGRDWAGWQVVKEGRKKMKQVLVEQTGERAHGREVGREEGKKGGREGGTQEIYILLYVYPREFVVECLRHLNESKKAHSWINLPSLHKCSKGK